MLMAVRYLIYTIKKTSILSQTFFNFLKTVMRIDDHPSISLLLSTLNGWILKPGHKVDAVKSKKPDRTFPQSMLITLFLLLLDKKVTEKLSKLMTLDSKGRYFP